MKKSADLGGCYPPRPSASVDNTLLDLQNKGKGYFFVKHSENYNVLAIEIDYSMVEQPQWKTL